MTSSRKGSTGFALLFQDFFSDSQKGQIHGKSCRRKIPKSKERPNSNEQLHVKNVRIPSDPCGSRRIALQVLDLRFDPWDFRGDWVLEIQL